MTKTLPRFLLALAVVGAAAAFAVRGEWPWTRLSDVPTAHPIVVSSPFRVVSDTLHSGESVSTLFERQGVTGLDLSALANALRFDPRRLRAGQVFSVRRDAATDEPTHIEFRANATQRLRFIRTAAGGWAGEAVPVRWTMDTIRVGATIENSLAQALDDEVSDATFNRAERAKLIYDLADVYAYSIDFSRDIQPGDRFAAVVERLRSEEGETRFGKVLAGELVTGGKAMHAFQYPDVEGQAAFYDGEGKALKRAFLAAPVAFRYISSNFSRARFHPILGRFRKHEGTDYKADPGTPVVAAAEGTVLRAGYSGGYGNLVELRHRNGVTTRYAHMRRVTVRTGARVSQGQKVGEVGSTGLSSGPHLHYEFRIDGVARDPRSIKGESGAPLPRSELAAFERRRDVLLQLLSRGTAPLTAD